MCLGDKEDANESEPLNAEFQPVSLAIYRIAHG